MVETELKSLFLSDERRAELLKKIRTPRKWSLFSTETCNSSFFGSWNLLAETQSSWPFPPRRPSRCFDTRRNETAVIVVVVPAAAWRLSAQTKSWPKLNDLNRLDLRILQKQNTNKSLNIVFKETRKSRKSPLGMVIPSGRHCGFCRVVHFSRVSFRGAIPLRQASLAQGELEKVGFFTSVETPTL